jgi:hypothetical protein
MTPIVANQALGKFSLLSLKTTESDLHGFYEAIVICMTANFPASDDFV